MRWEIETWRKLYTRVDARWLRLDVSARGLGDELLRYADDTGFIELGLPPDADATTIADCVGRLVCSKPNERSRLRRDVAQLLEARPGDPSFLIAEGGGISIRNFLQAQDRNGTKRSAAAERTRNWRERQRSRSDGDALSDVTVTSPTVTRDASRGDVLVTDPVPVPVPVPVPEKEDPPVPPGGGRTSPKPEPKRRKHRIPDGWQPAPRTLELLAGEGVPPAVTLAMLPEFVDYWTGDGGTKVDWDSTFRNRVRALRDAGRLPAAPPPSTPPRAPARDEGPPVPPPPELLERVRRLGRGPVDQPELPGADVRWTPPAKEPTA